MLSNFGCLGGLGHVTISRDVGTGRIRMRENQVMTHMLDISEILVASWALAGNGERIPTSHGILDRALKEAVQHDTCPPWVRDNLHFVDSRIGLQCVELPSLLDWAQRAQLTSAPNPSYQSAQIQISKMAARDLVSSLNVTAEDARLWGEHLKTLVDGSSGSTSDNSAMAIEEY